MTGFSEDQRIRAHMQLMLEIREHRDADEKIPCLDAARADWWISEDREEAEAAAHGCLGCPALIACGRYVEAFPEKAGVWAGRVPTRRTGGGR